LQIKAKDFNIRNKVFVNDGSIQGRKVSKISKSIVRRENKSMFQMKVAIKSVMSHM